MISHGICLTYLTECPQGLSMLLQMARFHSFLWLSIIVVVFQSPSCVQLFETPSTGAYQSFLSFTIFQSLPKFMFIALVMPSSHLILWCPLFLLPSIFSSIRDFSNELSVHIRWPKYWSFSYSSNPSSKYSGLISLKIYWFDLLALQGTFRHLLQHQSEGINALASCLLYGLTLRTVQDHWEDHSLDYME